MPFAAPPTWRDSSKEEASPSNKVVVVVVVVVAVVVVVVSLSLCSSSSSSSSITITIKRRAHPIRPPAELILN